MTDSIKIQIETAAARITNGQIYSVPRPFRHHNIHQVMREKGVKEFDIHSAQQGFLTNTGDFVNRLQALEIARSSGQIIRETSPQHGLFSEDLW